MRGSRWSKTLAPVTAAAVIGNVFVGRKSMAWFHGLRRPAMQLPMPALLGVGVVYYVLMAVVVHRAVTGGDARTYRRALVVLVGNEAWNAVFFGRRSARAGFLGVVGFLLPLGLLQAAVAGDRASRLAVGTYVVWVVGYDLPWTYRLWRLNPTAS